VIPANELAALREGAALVEMPGRGWVAVTGADRVRWLHAMVSNDIQGLQTGQQCYCFLLDAQGHIQADAYVRAEPQFLLLSCEGVATARLIETLDRYIFMDQVEMEDVSAQFGTLAVLGPKAESLPLSGLIAAAPQEIGGLRERLKALGAEPVGWAAYNHWRIAQGIPRLGEDMGETTLAQETGQIRAVSFHKGCYLGQEIVERVRSRGHLNRHLAGFVGAGLVPGAKVTVEGQEAGWITSVSEDLALGYLRREYAVPGQAVNGGTAHVRTLPACVFDW
jgi:aminomethyltransferase